MLKKIVFLTKEQVYVPMFWNSLAQEKCQEYGFDFQIPAKGGNVPDIDWSSILADAEGIITTWGSPICTANFLKIAPKVKIIGHCGGSPVAVTDLSTFEAGVAITTANPVMAEAVAEWSLLATLLAQRNLTEYAQIGNVLPMNWENSALVRDIHEMTIGLWGLGDTTRHLLRLLQPLQPGRILVCSNHSSEEELREMGAEKVTLETLLRESDVFHCLVGVNPNTYQLLGRKEFLTMKRNAVFVNGGRARLTKEEELIEVLKTDHIHAVLDVYDVEPLPKESPLRTLSNVILTPHNAGFTGRCRFLPFLLDEFNRFFQGEKLVAGISRNRYLQMTDEHLAMNKRKAE